MAMAPHPRASVKVDKYLDSACTRRQVLNAFEQLMEVHIAEYHTPLCTRAWRKIAGAVRRLKIKVREAQNA